MKRCRRVCARLRRWANGIKKGAREEAIMWRAWYGPLIFRVLRDSATWIAFDRRARSTKVAPSGVGRGQDT